MRIEVTVPSLLRDCTDGQTSFPLEAETLEEAIERLTATYPLLRVHLYNEAGELRQHVLMFYNDSSIAWLDRLDIRLNDGDRLLVMQAVSGG